MEENATATFTVAPKQNTPAKNYDESIAIKVGSDTYGAVAAKFTVTSPVNAAPTITTSTLPNGTVGTAYTETLTATGYPVPKWSIASGNLPAGLTLDKATGAITGTPTVSGTSSFTVTAENSVGNATKALSITVNSTITGITITPVTATVKQSKTQQFAATVNGTGASTVTWSMTGGTRSGIDENGLLRVGNMEKIDTVLTVKATSTADSAKFATATVTVAAALKIVTLTFDSDGGSAVNPISGIEEGKTVTLPISPTKANHRWATS